jgi:hypothetical protein
MFREGDKQEVSSMQVENLMVKFEQQPSIEQMLHTNIRSKSIKNYGSQLTSAKNGGHFVRRKKLQG